MSKNQKDEIDEEEEGKPKKGKKGLLILLLIVLLLGGAGAGLFLSGMLDGLLGKGEEKAEETAAEESKDEKTETGKGEAAKGGKDAKGGKEGEAVAKPVFYKLPQIIANLTPTGGANSFIAAEITIEAPNELVRAKVEAMQPKIMDAINIYIRELRPSDLRGSAGQMRLKEELMLRINKALYPDEINNILFEKLLIQ